MNIKVVSKAKEVAAFAVLAFLAGLMLSLGCMSYLYITSYDPSSMILKLAGSLAFTIGLLFIVFFGFKLFTGLNVDLIHTNWRQWYKLPLCFICDSIGLWLGALLAFKTSIGHAIMERAAVVSEAKLSANLGGVFLSAILCGILITIAILGYRKFIDHPSAAITAVIIPISLFVLLGFEHSVANQMYFALTALNGGGFPAMIILHTFIVMIGNIIGGMLVPALITLKEKLEDSASKYDSNISSDPAPVLEDFFSVGEDDSAANDKNIVISLSGDEDEAEDDSIAVTFTNVE